MATGDTSDATGDRGQETGDRRQGTGGQVRGPEVQQAEALGSAGGSTVRRRDEHPEAAADRFSAQHPENP